MSTFRSEKPAQNQNQPEHGNLNPIGGDTNMGQASGNGRIYRNPSGRSARIPVELIKDGDGSSTSTPIQRPTKAAAPKLLEKELPPTRVYQDFGWAEVTGSFRREHAIEGLLFGVAIGNALGLGRTGLRRGTSLRLFGRGPLQYCAFPFVGIVGHDMLRLLMTMQSVLRSRSQLEAFRRGFANRLRLNLLTIPLFAGATNLIASLRLCLGAPADLSGIDSNDNSPLVSALGIASVLQGTGHSVERWVALCTEVTHASPEAVEASVLVARAVYLAVMTEPSEANACAMIDRLINITEDPTIADFLKKLREGLLRGLSPHEMASELGWKRSIPKSARPTALMAVYAWLANTKNFEAAVERAVLLGGDSATLGAVTGGLAGIHLGTKKIPHTWLSRMTAWPNSHRWLVRMSKRFIDWPHGSEDLHVAPGMPARPVGQFLRACFINVVLLLGGLLRMPWRLAGWLIRD
jgi:ADP-ribosyl-[dinitrogen reductase] hydrolase